LGQISPFVNDLLVAQDLSEQTFLEKKQYFFVNDVVAKNGWVLNK